MYLELADGYLDDCINCSTPKTSIEQMLTEPDLLPVMDNDSGKIYFINPEGFLKMDQQEQQLAIIQAPLIMDKLIQGANMGGFFQNAKQKIQNFTEKVKDTAQKVRGVMPPSPLQKAISNVKAATGGVPTMVANSSQEVQTMIAPAPMRIAPQVMTSTIAPPETLPEIAPQWSGSFEVTPPQLWYTRPSFLIPAGLAAVGIAWAIMRKK